MTEHEYLAERFETHRAHLRAVAYRILSSADEADDAVQEAWIRLSRAGAGRVEHHAGWLTTVVARVCLDMLRSRRPRRQEPLSLHHVAGNDPEHEVLLADSVGLAMLVVLETFAPAERVAFVLHDLFGLPFDEIAPIVGRTPSAARQLASRGRRRVRGADAATGDLTLHREIVDAFLAASRGGDFEGLLPKLGPVPSQRSRPQRRAGDHDLEQQHAAVIGREERTSEPGVREGKEHSADHGDRDQR